MHVHIYICIYTYVCVCVCVCVYRWSSQVEGADALFADRYDDAEATWARHDEWAGCAYGLALLQVCVNVVCVNWV